ncbi:type IV secretory system conjugative DNA transfer family protein [Nocardia seriolae]|uniref:TraD/TraG TraM recognition site domain-containing protein n=1 Tax=Nocardia seriolae TaxID=37332 RepID=A0ABC8ATX4_9NOCA|nr:type IV secretory system conjugative DNA transfer family protein [Nocardia seriolae]APA97599.1 hypothetical protein NS506_03547 [Nocardia seriolae]MTJ62483.1 hypothetical protein [Nocardia seriolae]MTJ75509.1 hypothetical protein [Nocardia seriolae]MTJ87384.1 hypothetical protein [Nocardia seriolae]MTK31376.1 hypothetical protein [Nocardia seriolae]
MSGSDCVPLITPEDCGPTTTAPVPTTTPPPDTGLFTGLHPEAPPGTPKPLQQATDWHWPDASGVLHGLGTGIAALAVVSVVVLVGLAAAYRWPLSAARLRNFSVATVALPMVSAVASWSWSVPFALFWTGASRISGGDWSGLRAMLVVAVPAGSLVAVWWWAKFLLKTDTVYLKSVAHTERVKAALAERRSRAAARAAKLGAPYSAGANIVLGTHADQTDAKPPGLWRALTSRHMHWLMVPHREVKKHLGIIATTGSGKTQLIIRFVLAVLDYEWRAWWQWKDVPGMRARHPRPLIVVITCKGGQDDIELGTELVGFLLAMGIDPDRIATVVPGGDRLDIYQNMPARDMRAIHQDLIAPGEATTSEGQHFDEMRRRIVSMVIDAPIGPPNSPAEFLRRLNPEVIKDIWGHSPDIVRQVKALQADKVPQIDDALIRCTNLFELLTDADGRIVFDGGKQLEDIDFLFMTVPALDRDAARAQVSATLRLIMQRAGRTARHARRSVTVFLDEASKLNSKAGSIELEDVAERGRSQGVSLVFSSQSPEGLAGNKWELDRLLKACAGGMILGYFENAGELCKHFGSVRYLLPSRHLIKGQRHGDEGQVSVGERWLVDPDRVRGFDIGEFVYAKGGHADFGRVVQAHRATVTPLPGTPAAEAARRSDAAGGTDTATAAA